MTKKIYIELLLTIFIFEGRGWPWLPLPLSTFENFWRKNKSGLCRKRLPKEKRTQVLSAFKILNQHLEAPGSSVKGDLWFTFDIFYQFFDQC